MPELILKGISKRFGKQEALCDVQLVVEDGEFCVLVGPSGCGKSTLLNVIAGLIPQDEGTVILEGRSIDRLSPRERDIAMVFQSYALYPHMTVAQNLGFGLRMRKVPKGTVRERVHEVARLLGIEDLLERKPRDLSGGQRQRVAMGRALVRRPKLFLLDEPLSNLDARLRANVRLELKRLHQEVRGTIVYVTHDQVEAMTLGDKVVVMRDGRIRQIGTPEAIYARPADTFVASFIGSPEMNLLRGRLAGEQGRLSFHGSGFSVELKGVQTELEEGEVEIGIRPEDLEIGSGADATIGATVEMVSDVGSEKYILARLGEETITLRAPKGKSVRAGTNIQLILNPAHIHIFRRGERVEASVG